MSDESKVTDPTIQSDSQSKKKPRNCKLASDELRIIRECNREAFVVRSLPLGTGLGLAAYLAVRNGYLKASPKYGAKPKILLGVILGMVLGRISYQSICSERMMQLPNSKLGEYLRQRKKGGFYESFTADQRVALVPFSSPIDLSEDTAPVIGDEK